MEFKKKHKKNFQILILIVVLQIFLLTNYVVAQSYLIHQTDEEINKIKIDSEKNIPEEIIGFGINLLIGIFSIKQIGIISAESLSCCMEMNNGAICQNVPPGDDVLCKDVPIPTKCEDVVECGLGCCIDEKEGICSSKSTKLKCETNGGVWKDEPSCLIDECVQGCCVLNEEVKFTTEQQCIKLSREAGTNLTYEKGLGELECLNLKQNQEVGACLFQDRTCVFGNEISCRESGGYFYGGYLCSYPELNSICQKQNSVGCFEGKDEIYWFDSCENRENIYSSDKVKSWNGGKVLTKEESCGANSGNIESSTCGNCNYMLGSQCSESKLGSKSVKDGGYICENKNCIDEKGVERENGESWCDYDGTVGLGRDLVGSRHWVMSCIDGEIKAEGCKDLRYEVCTEEKTFDPETKELVESDGAKCRPNDWEECLTITEKYLGGAKASKKDVENDLISCITNPDCYVGITADLPLVGETLPLVCLPNYPPATTDKCSLMGNIKCEGPYCNHEWVEQMNDICTSLGDCGIWPNIEGKIPRNLWLRANPFPSTAYMLAIAKHTKTGFLITAINVIIHSQDLINMDNFNEEYWKKHIGSILSSVRPSPFS